MQLSLALLGFTLFLTHNAVADFTAERSTEGSRMGKANLNCLSSVTAM